MGTINGSVYAKETVHKEQTPTVYTFTNEDFLKAAELAYERGDMSEHDFT